MTAGETNPSSGREVRLLVLCAGDPASEITFSGSARSLIQALESRGIVHAKCKVTAGLTDTFSPPPWARLIQRADRLGLLPHYRGSRMAMARNTSRARRM